MPNKNSLNQAYVVDHDNKVLGRGISGVGDLMSDSQTTNRSDKSDTMSGSRLIDRSTTSLQRQNQHRRINSGNNTNKQQQQQETRQTRLLPIDWNKRTQKADVLSSDDDDVIVTTSGSRHGSSSKIRTKT